MFSTRSLLPFLLFNAQPFRIYLCSYSFLYSTLPSSFTLISFNSVPRLVSIFVISRFSSQLLPKSFSPFIYLHLANSLTPVDTEIYSQRFKLLLDIFHYYVTYSSIYIFQYNDLPLSFAELYAIILKCPIFPSLILSFPPAAIWYRMDRKPRDNPQQINQSISN